MPVLFGPRRGHSGSTVFLFCSMASKIQGKAGQSSTKSLVSISFLAGEFCPCCTAEGSPGERGQGCTAAAGRLPVLSGVAWEEIIDP